jgi:hypothetical protein
LIDIESDENNDSDASADAQEEEELLLCPSSPFIWNEQPEVIVVGINHVCLEIDKQLHDFDFHVFESIDDHIGGEYVTDKKVPTTIQIILLKRYKFIQSPVDLNLIIKFDLSLLI